MTPQGSMTSLGKGVTIALFASLMLNAFLLGVMATHLARGHHGRAGRPPPHFEGGPRGGGERFGRRGPAEAQLLRDVMRASGGPRDPRVREALSQGRRKMAAHRERMEQAENAVRQALSAQPYDESRLTLALGDLRRAAETGQTEAQETLVRLAAQLSQGERAELQGQRSAPAPP